MVLVLFKTLDKNKLLQLLLRQIKSATPATCDLPREKDRMVCNTEDGTGNTYVAGIWLAAEIQSARDFDAASL